MEEPNYKRAGRVPGEKGLHVPDLPRLPRGEAETGGIAITILLALSEKFQEGD